MKYIEQIKVMSENMWNSIFWYNIDITPEAREFLEIVNSWETVNDVDPVMFFEFENLCFDILQVIQGKERKIIKIEN